MTKKQRFLFLQGVCSPFFPRLALALRQTGHVVRKVNFTVGDRMYWRIGQADNYRGPMDALGDFYSTQYATHGITDIVLFGDCRHVHRPAIEQAKSQGIRIHVFEEGYFRPYWVTLERDGVNAHSTLPKDPAWYNEQARLIPQFDNGTAFKTAFWKRAAYDVGYNFWAGLNPVLHHGVRSHVPYSPATEYLGYVRRAARIKLYERHSRQIESKLISETAKNPFFLLPLQLATDAQIVHHSPFANMADAMRHTLLSFAKHAPQNARLAVKIHPLDPGLVNYRSLLRAWARELGLENRTYYLESGNLPALLSSTSGVVTVNSTVGSSALIHGRRIVVLGDAIYDIPGLTHQQGLDNFWTAREKPDKKFFNNFRNVVIQKTQINGGFYCENGINLAISNSIKKIITAI